LGYIIRMDKTGVAKMVFESKPEGMGGKNRKAQTEMAGRCR
jgi:hypothetical protein